MDIRRLAIFLGLTLFIGWAGYAITRQFGPHAQQGTITVAVVPTSASILIDGKSAGRGSNTVTVGSHTVTAKKDGFKTQSQTVNVTLSNTSNTSFIMVSSSDNTKNWYKDNPKDAKEAEKISSQQSDYNSQQALIHEPIIKLLPASYNHGRGHEIKLDAGLPIKGSSVPGVYVTAATNADRADVFRWVKLQGYDVSNIDLVFYQEINYLTRPSGGGSNE